VKDFLIIYIIKRVYLQIGPAFLQIGP